MLLFTVAKWPWLLLVVLTGGDWGVNRLTCRQRAASLTCAFPRTAFPPAVYARGSDVRPRYAPRRDALSLSWEPSLIAGRKCLPHIGPSHNSLLPSRPRCHPRRALGAPRGDPCPGRLCSARPSLFCPAPLGVLSRGTAERSHTLAAGLAPSGSRGHQRGPSSKRPAHRPLGRAAVALALSPGQTPAAARRLIQFLPE